ncbi:MAG: hypothetical protein M3299_11480 [Thermoproteota archaeon]|nr:hypothetical protein [Thermoproteota archaeon]
MVIKIDLNFLPASFRSLIIRDIDGEYRRDHNLKYDTNVGYDDHEKENNTRIDNNPNIIVLNSNDKRDLQKIERMTKDILIKRRVYDHVVIQDAEEKDKIVILKREHSEQLGIYHCRHCGMAFEDEIQLSTHLRMHFFI